ncbi:glycosyl hydrolase [Gracilibacillus sp. HCP3S3_G5_1]|uniref:glycosyl hydrolase n=1 Tax=unclassified Gracilibacillus TaxID=2625209 RepID=UPI003F8A2CC2
MKIEDFQHPKPAYGIHPFWFWNGELTNEEISNQLKEMADKHVTGVYICARQGMEIPYLSDRWFEKVEFAIETAASYGMDVWLYDEYPYPSGMAGGEVTLEHKDAKQTMLVHHVEKVNGEKRVSIPLPWGKILYAKAVPVKHNSEQLLWEKAIDLKLKIGNLQVEHIYQKTGLTAYNQRRFFTYGPKKVLEWDLPQGDWEIHCFIEEELEDFKYYGTFVDPLHKEAIQTFIQVTHERYLSKVGKHFGQTVKGMFTDETHLLGRFPWSPQLVPYIKDTYGYDIREYLYLLITNGEHAAKVRYHYFQSIHVLLRDVYHKQIHDWCEKAGIDYVAEVPSARMSGQVYSHVPGGDSAHEKLGRPLDWILKKYFFSMRANPKMISALSNQLNRDRTLIECFHSVGWSMTLQDAKWMVDRLAVLGINFFNFHAFFYTLNSLVKHDAPPSQFIQNPYWKYFKKLGDYVSRISYLMAQGEVVRPIAVLDPTTSFWTKMANPFSSFSYVGECEEEKALLERLKKDWADICLELTKAHKDYDHLDPEILMEAKIEDGKINIGKATYKVLILPPMTNLEKRAWDKIKLFLDQGGSVVANGLLPSEDIEEDTSHYQEMKQLFNGENCSESNAFFIPFSSHATDNIKMLFNLLDHILDEEVFINVKDPSQSFLVQHRKLDNSELLFITNQEGDRHEVSLGLYKARENHAYFLIDLEKGERTHISSVFRDGFRQIDLQFEPYQSYMVQVEETSDQVISKSEGKSIEIASKQQWQLETQDENMVRFDSFLLEILGSDIQGCPVTAKTFIDQCEDLAQNNMLPVSFKQLFGTPMKLQLNYPINVNYKTNFIVEKMPADCTLVMDKNAISEGLSIFINNHKVDPDSLQKMFVYDHNNIVSDIRRYLVEGENLIAIKGKIHKDWDGVVDPVYFKGDFGVQFNEEKTPILVEMPTTTHSLVGPFERLPFYAGTLAFTRNIELDPPENTSYRITIEEIDEIHDVVEVMVNDVSLGVKAWSPYIWEASEGLLRKGENKITVRIIHTLAGLLEGKYFDYDKHELVDVREID